jgi:hypothetical protein
VVSGRYPFGHECVHNMDGQQLGTSLRKSRADGRTWIDELYFPFPHIMDDNITCTPFFDRYPDFFFVDGYFFHTLLFTTGYRHGRTTLGTSLLERQALTQRTWIDIGWAFLTVETYLTTQTASMPTYLFSTSQQHFLFIPHFHTRSLRLSFSPTDKNEQTTGADGKERR